VRLPAVRRRFVWPADDLVTTNLRLDDLLDRALARVGGRTSQLGIDDLDPNTSVAVLGFPRSANTLLSSWLAMVVRPGVVVVGGRHSHSVLDLYRLTKAGVAVIVPVREPVDACASMMVRKGQPESEGAGRDLLRAYAGWHAAALPFLASDLVTLATFHQITTAPHSVVDGDPLAGLVNQDAVNAHELDDVVERTRASLASVPGQGQPENGIPSEWMISLPDSARADELAAARAVLQRPRLMIDRYRAERSYEAFMSAAEVAQPGHFAALSRRQDRETPSEPTRQLAQETDRRAAGHGGDEVLRAGR
jgi:hypothetical protein